MVLDTKDVPCAQHEDESAQFPRSLHYFHARVSLPIIAPLAWVLSLKNIRCMFANAQWAGTGKEGFQKRNRILDLGWDCIKMPSEQRAAALWMRRNLAWLETPRGHRVVIHRLISCMKSVSVALVTLTWWLHCTLRTVIQRSLLTLSFFLSFCLSLCLSVSLSCLRVEKAGLWCGIARWRTSTQQKYQHTFRNGH